MRNAFAQRLTEIARQDQRVVLLAGDIGNRLFDNYKQLCPGRFFNCGVAEGSMMSVAAGMAMSGLRPVVYTIAPFVTVRCLEQIRVDVCYHNQPVVIVGVGGGLSYASLGATHHSCEDIAMLRSLPGMRVVCPADPLETKACLSEALREPGPIYLRLGKKGEPLVHDAEPQLTLGSSLTICEGSEVALLATGTILPEARAAVDLLAEQGISVHLISMPTIKPLDDETLQEVFQAFRLVATVEEHSRLGGLGGAVAEWAAVRSVSAEFLPLGTPDEFLHHSWNQSQARKQWGLDGQGIATAIQARMGRLTD